MKALDIHEPIPIEKADLVKSSILAKEFNVTQSYVRLIILGTRNAKTKKALAIKTKAIKMIEAIENLEN